MLTRDAFFTIGYAVWVLVCLGAIASCMSVGCVAVDSGAVCGVFLHKQAH